MTPAPPSTDRFWPAVLAALGAMYVGIGLARFAYTPLLPAVIAAGWFPADQAAYLGAANLAGYLAGALAGRRLAVRWSTAVVGRAMILATAASLFACAVPVSFAWFSAWRFLSGVTGGVLMVIAAPAALRIVPPERRGLASGVIFTGVGLGITSSGVFVPLLLGLGLRETWATLGLATLAIAAASWRFWPPEAGAGDLAARPESPAWPAAATALVCLYALVAVGLVPHMVFLVAYVAQGIGAGIAAGSAYWVLFGVGASVGPSLFGQLADRLGVSRTLALALAAQIAAGVLILTSTALPALAASSLLVGAFTPGCIPLILGRIREIFHDPVRQQTAWGRATMIFAVTQAAAGYALSAVFAHGAYHLLFGIGAAAFTLALLLELGRALLARRLARL